MAAAAVRRRLSWQQAEVLAVQRETPTASRLTLHVPEWAGHLAGQHVDVRLSAPDGYTAQRSYSIASAPQEPGLQLIVDRLEDGEVSPYLTEELRPGDLLELRGPIGGYFIWPDAGPVQLIAGGSGVVPFLAMLAHHRLSASSSATRLLYSARTESDVIARKCLAEPLPGVEVTVTLTRAAPAGWTGLSGRVDAVMLSRHCFGPDLAPRLLVCGPTGFVETVSRALIELGHDPAGIKTERFGATGGPP